MGPQLPMKVQVSHWKFPSLGDSPEKLSGRAGGKKELETELEFPGGAQYSHGGPGTISSYPTSKKAHLG